MKLSVIQPDLVWENISANLQHLGELVSPLGGKTELVILPEMFNTGFTMQTKTLAEPPDGETFLWMMGLAQKFGFAICGSYIVIENGKIFNRWVFVGPGMERWHYDKHHPFSISGEDKVITPGKKRLVFSYKGFRISPFICYDLRFPVWNRNQNDTDLIIYAANWPASRKNVWNILLKARAIENECYVAGSNRVGTDGSGIHYSGDSMIIDYRGEIISSADAGFEQCITSEISMDRIIGLQEKISGIG